MEYLHWDEKTIPDFSEKNISDMYEHGYVFTRIGKGVMHQTRSVRIDVSKFELSSENRRVLKKTDGIELKSVELPLKEYDYKLGMDAKYFYDTKFGPGVMSAQKVKEMLTDSAKSNFNCFLTYAPPRNIPEEIFLGGRYMLTSTKIFSIIRIRSIISINLLKTWGSV